MHLLDVGGNLPVRLYMEWHFWQLCGHYPYLCTTRTRTEPRTFKHLGRLVEYLEEHFPTVTEVTLTLPPNKRPESWPPPKKRPNFGSSEGW